MTRVLWIVELSALSVLTVAGFYAAAPFRHTFLDTLLVLAPVLIVFAAFPAVRTISRESVSLTKSFTWWQALWLIMFLSALVFRVRDEYDIHQSALDGWAMFRIGLDAIVGLILVQRLLSGKTYWIRSLFSGLIGIMAVYPLICLVSTSWSVVPGFTLFRSVEYLLDLSLLAAIVVTLDSVEQYEKFANWTWILLALLVLSAWIGAIVDPSDGLMEGYAYGPLRFRLEGVCPTLDANSIGEYCAILAGISLCRMLDDPEGKYDRQWYRLLLVAALVTLIFTQTRAAVGAFLCSFVLLFIYLRKYLLGAAIAITASFAGTILLFFTHFGNTVWTFLLRGQTATEAEGMSGRLQMWQFAWEKISERPLIGYGGYAGGRFVVLPGLGILGKSDVLSTPIEAFLDIGIWGPLVLVIVLAGIWWSLLRSSRSPLLTQPERHLSVEILMAATIVSIRCVVAGNITSHASIAFLTVLACAEFLRRRMKSPSQPMSA
jgi:O-antigen ligase